LSSRSSRNTLRRHRNRIEGAELLHSVPLFAALGDTVRLRLVVRLCEEGSASISKLTAGTGLTRQAITKHLCVMQSSGLVRSTKRGRERLWQLNQQRLQDARRHLDLISNQWDAALARLQKLVED
jgi:DNA-binding transcriptional ArsR family regulator